MLLVSIGCETEADIKKRHNQAEAAGRRDGEITGRTDGRKATYEPARQSAYDSRIWALYNSNNYNRKPGYVVMILSISFLLGFGVQYAVLYFLRRKDLLPDIDRIILPKHNTQANFKELL